VISLRIKEVGLGADVGHHRELVEGGKRTIQYEPLRSTGSTGSTDSTSRQEA
jgi:hypothetical protein